MKRLLRLLPLALFGVAALDAKDPSVDPQEIIRRFAEKESEFRSVWQKYTYTQRISFEVLDNSDRVRERRDMKIEVYFTNDGQRKTRVVSDRGALRSVGVTDEDIQDALSLQPFVLTTEELPNYQIKYEGREWVDLLDTYIFDVEPRKMEKDKRYFKGRIWVDTLDFQIVMTRGKAVPDYADNKFPEFETRREQIDGQYWFPTWTMADDVLYFGSFYDRQGVHIREIITYDDYQKFEVDTTIKYGPVQGPVQDEEPIQENPEE
ncbi:MAG: hypothetical protein ACRD1R_07785 [Acidobacteriota bacterium]